MCTRRKNKSFRAFKRMTLYDFVCSQNAHLWKKNIHRLWQSVLTSQFVSYILLHFSHTIHPHTIVSAAINQLIKDMLKVKKYLVSCFIIFHRVFNNNDNMYEMDYLPHLVISTLSPIYFPWGPCAHNFTSLYHIIYVLYLIFSYIHGHNSRL
jgi:hypothetical protein